MKSKLMPKLEENTREGRVLLGHPLYEVINRAYAVFKQEPTEHGVCDCCMDEKIRADFFSHGQRGLPFDYLRDWFFAAADIPMAQAPWKFVLPRILESLAAGEEPSNTGFEVCLSRYLTGERDNWGNTQWQVLDEFQRVFLRLCANPNNEFLDDYVCMFANAGWPAEKLFAQVFAWEDEILINRFWNDWCRFGRPSIWVTAFWKDSSVPIKFYTSEKLLSRITNYALDEKNPRDIAEKAMSVSDVIFWGCI